MKEFIIKNKKSVIVFLCAIVLIIVCSIVGSIVTSGDTETGISPRGDSSTGDVSAISYETYGADDISSVADGTESAVSDASGAVSAAESDASAQ